MEDNSRVFYTVWQGRKKVMKKASAKEVCEKLEISLLWVRDLAKRRGTTKSGFTISMFVPNTKEEKTKERQFVKSISKLSIPEQAALYIEKYGGGTTYVKKRLYNLRYQINLDEQTHKTPTRTFLEEIESRNYFIDVDNRPRIPMQYAGSHGYCWIVNSRK